GGVASRKGPLASSSLPVICSSKASAIRGSRIGSSERRYRRYVLVISSLVASGSRFSVTLPPHSGGPFGTRDECLGRYEIEGHQFGRGSREIRPPVPVPSLELLAFGVSAPGARAG